jgi:geranylgeranyl reductase family protein
LAWHGHAVTLIERQPMPRPKACGNALTPRALHQLRDMSLPPTALAGAHRTVGVRAIGRNHKVDVAWPEHDVYPDYGLVMQRHVLDAAVLSHAATRGVNVIEGYEAVQPIVDRGFVRGAIVQQGDGTMVELHARYVVVADGADSRFGRSLGTFRTREWPYAVAASGSWSSIHHADAWLETSLTIRDEHHNHLPGYGWAFPTGDGTVTIGVGLLSTFRDFKGVNASTMLHTFLTQVAERWDIDVQHPQHRPTSSRVPMGGSVGPNAGPTYLVVGDAAAMVSPFNGAGIEYALETGRLAADVLHEAIGDDSPAALQRFPAALDDAYGDYFKCARLFARFMGKPGMMRHLVDTGSRNRRAMEWFVRLSSNMLRSDEFGPAEAAFKTASMLMKLAPNA